MPESNQKPKPTTTPGSEYDPGWDSGLSGRIGGQGFMGAPPPRNPPKAPEGEGVEAENKDEFPRDREHLTEADQKGEGAPKAPDAKAPDAKAPAPKRKGAAVNP